MARVRAKNTKPEIQVRALLHRIGYRYRVHARYLPGRPDLAFTARRKAIFIHGCFWHAHQGCPGARIPKSNADYWVPKLDGNRRRDLENEDRLKQIGWDVLVIWECELKDVQVLQGRLVEYLGDPRFKMGLARRIMP